MGAHYIVKVDPPAGITPGQRDVLAQILVRFAERFSFAGMRDWEVELGSRSRVLGTEAEFLDLSGNRNLLQGLEVYFRKRADAARFVSLIRAGIEGLKVGAPRKQAAKDWLKLWRRHYRPQKIGRIWVYPAWRKVPAGKRAVRIYPGQAFGTGTHATTRGCLKLFQAAAGEISDSASIMDFGAGTGVLALAALRWGKAEGKRWRAEATEIDPVARTQTRKNARANRLPLSIAAGWGKKKNFALIFANVLAPVLLKEAKQLEARLMPGGTLLLSGILRKEAKTFLQEFLRRAGSGKLVFVEEWQEGDWSALRLVKLHHSRKTKKTPAITRPKPTK